MRARDHQRVADAVLDQARAVFGDYGVWYPQLCEQAQVGYSSGLTGSRGGGIADPTFAAAIAYDEARTMRKAHDKDMILLRNVLARIEKRRVWTRARGLPTREPGPIICENLACSEPISGRGSDVQREGLCPKCYQHRRRYGLAWPKKHVTPDEARRMGA